MTREAQLSETHPRLHPPAGGGSTPRPEPGLDGSEAAAVERANGRLATDMEREVAIARTVTVWAGGPSIAGPFQPQYGRAARVSKVGPVPGDMSRCNRPLPACDSIADTSVCS